MNRVNGKVVIVTGAARGMGAAFAKRLIDEGAQVMLTDLLAEAGKATAQSLGANARFMAHDVTSEAQWKAVVAATEAAFGPVNVLINNAGISAGGMIETMEESYFRRVIDIDMVSVFLGMKSVLPSMKRAGAGSIINISSIAGIVGNPGVLPYTAAKFAVRGMTKSAAAEFAPYNIRVNSIHPGIISTPMTTTESINPDLIAQVAAGAPAGRAGEPDEVAAVVLMLASDETRFSTGAEFVVDGGRPVSSQVESGPTMNLLSGKVVIVIGAALDVWLKRIPAFSLKPGTTPSYVTTILRTMRELHLVF